VQNALGAVQSLLVLGGSSDIGAAIAERLVPDGCSTVVLAGRRPEAMEPLAERLRSAGARVAMTNWDAVDVGGHADAVKAAWAAAVGSSSRWDWSPSTPDASTTQSMSTAAASHAAFTASA
jgi:NADP-dependent 3-hydroxy acid dehydrogenase YdfG